MGSMMMCSCILYNANRAKYRADNGAFQEIAGWKMKKMARYFQGVGDVVHSRSLRFESASGAGLSGAFRGIGTNVFVSVNYIIFL